MFTNTTDKAEVYFSTAQTDTKSPGHLKKDVDH